LSRLCRPISALYFDLFRAFRILYEDMFILHRFIIRELLVTFILSVIFLNSTLMMEKLMKLSKLLSSVGASAFDIGEVILYIQPQLLILTIPMSMLLSVLLTYGRLNGDNELVIMRSIGMPFRFISRPVMYVGIALFIVNIGISFYLGPLGGVMLREKITNILITRAPLAIEEGIFNTSFKDMVILIREKPSPRMISGIFISDERNRDEPKIIVAKEGHILSEMDSLSFALSGGHVYITSKDTLTEISFDSYYFKLLPSFKSSDRNIAEYTPSELISESKIQPDRKIAFLIELQRRISMPALCLIIIFLGPSLALLAGKSGRLGGLTVGLVIFAAYYMVLIYGENLAKSGSLPYFIGAWLSFTVLAVISVVAFERVNKR
jgi:lipopolysaccharide export system permease protein